MSRKDTGPSGRVDLRVGEWSSVMDLLRGIMKAEENTPGFIPGYDVNEMNDMYNEVGNRLEGEVDIGDNWNEPIGIELSEEVAMGIGEILDHIAEYNHAKVDPLPDIYVNPEDMADTIVSQWRTRS